MNSNNDNSEIKFNIGDKICDTGHSQYKRRIGIVVRNYRDGYPAGIKWDDGCQFDYTPKEFSRMTLANPDEKSVKSDVEGCGGCGSDWCRYCS